MTWGQIRMNLQASGPGVSEDLLDEFLNGRYEQILDSGDWKGLKYHSSIQTQAAYQSGTDTVTLTVGNTAVVGVGTSWQTTIIGQRFYRPGDTVFYTVTARASTTGLTLDRAYEGNGTEATGTVYAASAYVFFQHIYSLPSDARAVVSIIDPLTGLPLQEMTKQGLDAAAGQRTLVDNPRIFAVYDDSAETTLPVSHQIEFYPPPLRSRGFPIEYLHAAAGFTGANTTAGPLPWVSTSALLYGCRADIAAYLATQSEGAAAGSYLAQAKLYEAKYQETLARMLTVEHTQRRQMAPMQMADRFTRHRLARVSRGGRSWGSGQGGPN